VVVVAVVLVVGTQASHKAGQLLLTLGPMIASSQLVAV
jgi:hypothetical protein